MGHLETEAGCYTAAAAGAATAAKQFSRFCAKEARAAATTAYVVPAMVKTQTGRKGEEEGKKSIEALHMLHTVNPLPPVALTLPLQSTDRSLVLCCVA